MTESEWRDSADPDGMEVVVEALGLATARKRKLFACGICRRNSGLIRDPGCLSAIEIVERFAEGDAGPGDLVLARNRANNAIARVDPSWLAARAARLAVYCAALDEHATPWVQGNLRAARFVVAERRGETYARNEEDSRKVEADVIRELFGNPSRRLALEPSWLTTDVVATARSIHEGRAFSRMPELGRALASGGCGDRTILDHCLASEGHLLGCWALDSILGRS